MNNWQNVKYLLKAKKCIDSLLYISQHIHEISNLNMRDRVNEIADIFYLNLSYILDVTYSGISKKEICKQNKVIESIYYERDKNRAHKDGKYIFSEYKTFQEMIDKYKTQIEETKKVCSNVLPNNVTLNYVSHDRTLFRLINKISKEDEEKIKKVRHPGYRKEVKPFPGETSLTRKVLQDVDQLKNSKNDPKEYATIMETGINQYETLQNFQDFCVLTNCAFEKNIWVEPGPTFKMTEILRKYGFLDMCDVPRWENITKKDKMELLNAIFDGKITE